jgi:hypothetical protein
MESYMLESAAVLCIGTRCMGVSGSRSGNRSTKRTCHRLRHPYHGTSHRHDQVHHGEVTIRSVPLSLQSRILIFISSLASMALLVFGLYASQNRTSVLGTTSLYMVSAWVAFANSFQPNCPYCKLLPPSLLSFSRSLMHYLCRAVPKWPQYRKQRHMLHIGNGNFNVITDDFRKKGIEFLESKDFTDTFNL